MENYDVVVIGAGISGIGFAKCYLDVHPDCNLVLLERDEGVGGVWNTRRGYDTFWTQWTVGMAEFSDQPMSRPPAEDLYYEFFKAKHTTKYLENYVKQQSNQGKPLGERILLRREVLHASEQGSGWQIRVKDLENGSLSEIRTSKLVLATGLNSTAQLPRLPSADKFEGKIIHQEMFGSSECLSSTGAESFAVLGGGKSSADMVYSAVKAGKMVSWILKSTETTGPGFFLSPAGKGPYSNAFEIAMTRFASTFTPSILNNSNWWTKFLHSSHLGIKLMSGFWGAVDNDARKAADYEGRGCLQGFDKLSPHSAIFWQNATGGLLNQQDFFEVIAKNVRIFCDDIDFLEARGIHLKGGQSVPADVILCGTGWTPSLQFLDEKDKARLGLPYACGDERSAGDSPPGWEALERAAEKQVLVKFPQLANPPLHYSPPLSQTPYRLYRHIAPVQGVDDPRSVVMMGYVGVGNYFLVAECQALWATAYLDRKLDPPDVQSQRESVALFTAWCKRRYLSRGEEGNNMTFELLSYVDQLLQDLGLVSHRRGWFKDHFSPTTAQTLSGLKAEYLNKYTPK